MNATPIPPRDVKPADRPPPRDPQAAGGSDGETPASEARFTDLVKEAADEEARLNKAEKEVAKEQAAKEQAAKELAAKEQAGSPQESKSGGTVPPALADGQNPTEKDAAAANATKAEAQTALPAPPLVLAPPPRPVPPQAGTAPDQSVPHGDGRTLPIKATALPSAQGELSATKKMREPNNAVDKFDTLLTGSQNPGEALPSAPAQPSAAPVARAPEPPATMAAPAMPQPPLPVAALPATIAIKALSGSNRFDIRLDPEELGRIDVALEIDQDGGIRAFIAAEKPEALQLLVREARALEQAFDQAGFRRDDGALNFSLSDRQSSPQDQQSSQNRPQSTRFFVEGEGELPPTLAALVNASPNRADGRLDVRI